MEVNLRVVTIGDICMDVYPQLGKLSPGGNSVNIAVNMKNLGFDASFVGAVGQDDYGDRMINSLTEAGIDISHLRTLPGSTASIVVDLVNGERVYGEYDEGVLADFELSDEDKAFIAAHDMIHSSIWGHVEKDLPSLPGGPIQSFDFAEFLDHEIFDRIAPSIHYAFFSYTQDDPFIRDFLVRSHARGCRAVIVTLAENGSLAYDGTGIYKTDIVPVKVVDTLGAGDAFIAGFMSGILKKYEIDACLRLGAIKASETLTRVGAW